MSFYFRLCDYFISMLFLFLFILKIKRIDKNCNLLKSLSGCEHFRHYSALCNPENGRNEFGINLFNFRVLSGSWKTCSLAQNRDSSRSKGLDLLQTAPSIVSNSHKTNGLFLLSSFTLKNEPLQARLRTPCLKPTINLHPLLLNGSGEIQNFQIGKMS